MKILMKTTQMKFSDIENSTKNQGRDIRILECQISTDFCALKYCKNKTILKTLANL